MGLAHKEAVEVATRVIEGFADLFATALEEVYAAKLGLSRMGEPEASLAYDLLLRMAKGQADFTRVFRALSGEDPATARGEFSDPALLDDWLPRWRARVGQNGPESARIARMQAANPAFIARNHRVEEAIAAAVDGDYAPFERLVQVLAHPFDDQPEARDLALAPRPEEVVRQTFCGT